MQAKSAVSPSATLRVGLFFDGTGNNRSNSDLADSAAISGTSYANAPSNIALLLDLYPQGPGELADGSARTFLKRYVPGIGTADGQPDSTYDQLTGRGASGVAARAEQAMQAVIEQLTLWRQANPAARAIRLEFDLFGFSRGAAAARHLANALRKGHPALAELPFTCEIRICFIGLFDTVAAIVAPLEGNFSPANARYAGLQLSLGAGIAGHVVQLVAGDERRHNFPLVRTAHDIVLPGVHSDIGGGYPPRMLEQVLLCKPRSSREPLRSPVERSSAYAHVLALLDREYAQALPPRPQVITWEAPAGSGKPAEREKQVFAALYREREVAGELSLIYLSIMRELAAAQGVPFAPVSRCPLDPVLAGISRKLHAFALGHRADPDLTEAEQGLLQSRYVHTSAHWNAVGGLRNSDLDVLYIDRPSPAGRVLHDTC